MTCKEIQEMLSAFADDQLSKEEALAISQHLETCLDCRRELQEIKELQKVLSSLEDVPVPLAFDKRLHDALVREAEIMKKNKVIPLKKGKKTNWRTISSVAAVFMVGIFSVILYNNNLDEFNQQDISNYSQQADQSVLKDQQEQEKQMSGSQDIALQDETGQEQESVAPAPQNDGAAQQSAPIVKDNVDTRKPAKAASEVAETAPASQPLPYSTSSVSEEANTGGLLQSATPDELSDEPENGVQSRMKSSVFVTDEELDQYLKSLEDILIDIKYEVKNCTFDEQTGIWTMEIDVITVGEDGSEVREHAVYCGQDGDIWKKEL